MRTTFILVSLLVAASAAAAQGRAVPQLAPTEANPHQDRVEPRVERIHVEDKGSAIDELRVGGQTQRIHVQPKADVPAYEVLPEGGPRERAGAAGQRVWNVLSF